MALRSKPLLMIVGGVACVAMVIAGVELLEDHDWRGLLYIAGSVLVCVVASRASTLIRRRDMQ